MFFEQKLEDLTQYLGDSSQTYRLPEIIIEPACPKSNLQVYFYALETIIAPNGIDVKDIVTFDEKARKISIVKTTDARLSN